MSERTFTRLVTALIVALGTLGVLGIDIFIDERDVEITWAGLRSYTSFFVIMYLFLRVMQEQQFSRRLEKRMEKLECKRTDAMMHAAKAHALIRNPSQENLHDANYHAYEAVRSLCQSVEEQFDYLAYARKEIEQQ